MSSWNFQNFLADFPARISGNFRSMASCIFRTKSTISGREGRPRIGAKNARMAGGLTAGSKFCDEDALDVGRETRKRRHSTTLGTYSDTKQKAKTNVLSICWPYKPRSGKLWWYFFRKTFSKNVFRKMLSDKYFSQIFSEKYFSKNIFSKKIVVEQYVLKKIFFDKYFSKNIFRKCFIENILFRKI